MRIFQSNPKLAAGNLLSFGLLGRDYLFLFVDPKSKCKVIKQAQSCYLANHSELVTNPLSFPKDDSRTLGKSTFQVFKLIHARTLKFKLPNPSTSQFLIFSFRFFLKALIIFSALANSSVDKRVFAFSMLAQSLCFQHLKDPQ